MKIKRQNEIRLGLYTRGGLFQVSNKNDKTQQLNTYVGPYYFKNGSAFAGETPRAGDKKLQRIIRDKNIFVYNKLNTKYAKNFTGVIASPPLISEQDEEKGFFKRYFAKQLSDSIIIETDKNTYKEVKKQKTPHHKLYTALELEWKISGPIFNRLYRGNVIEVGIIPTNNALLEKAEDDMPGISNYISDTLEYANPTEQSELYTPGDQLTLENGDEYVGYYHIHVNRPMVGKFHTEKPHAYLIPLSDTIFDSQEKTEEEKILQTPTKTYNSLQ